MTATTPGNPVPPGRVFLRGPFAARTWSSLAYGLVNLPLVIVGFLVGVALLAAGAAVSVTFLGLPLIAVVVLALRWLGSVHRRLGRSMIRATVRDPQTFHGAPGFFGWLRSALRDSVGWRSAVYVAIKFLLFVPGVYLAVLVWAEALAALTYPVWWQLLDPTNIDQQGVVRHSALQFGDYYFDTWPRALIVSAAGLVSVWLAPWPARALAAIDRALIPALLGPTGHAERVRELEATRTRVVDDAALSLRRIERDLHDGTQARLVALAMSLGEAREALDDEADPARARELVARAHDTAKESLVELREVVRGFHPPVLDQGLEPALVTLASRSAVPVDVRVHLPVRPATAIETIAYFCVAELLTNVARHSGATHATVAATGGDVDGTLHLVVEDDGHGGAHAGAGSGLTGLAERVRTVDGRLTVVSPHGGPTAVSVDLPMRA